MKKDMEENPDMSMKLQAYYDKTRTDEAADAKPSSSSVASTQPKISHRSEKEKKADEVKLTELKKPSQPYSRSGGWQTIQQTTYSQLL